MHFLTYVQRHSYELALFLLLGSWLFSRIQI